ncbi:hypothetical protein OG625_13765 [Streptomyces sp. NBC_01351]|uniref:hypothetical protein n=1 Tax=Streptomyces sp. NBC_01351 TaxID=2903833 RepID=UPI002E2EA8DD|nr:hypothetical protein [Streptomyces sp. NBC_01351]
MIGEPELDGEWRTDGQPAEEAAAPEPSRGRPRPWLWALGGAVVASAVWAGVLAAQDRFTDAPRISYRHSEDLCKDAPLATLGSLAGGFMDGRQRHHEGPALDWSSCAYSSPRVPERASYYGEVQVELHKKTDPGPEFGTTLLLDPYVDLMPVDPEEVPGLGERALVGGQVRSPRLLVLDGGAVFVLTAQWWGEDGDAEIDGDALRAAMIEDARVLMETLKKK